jgi:hypothetical protein
MRLHFFIMLLAFFLLESKCLAAFEGIDHWLSANGCVACHESGKKAPDSSNAGFPNCNSCHIKSGLQLYQHAPELKFFVIADGNVIPRFHAEGLKNFLLQQVKRHHTGLGTMSPLSLSTSESLLSMLTDKRLLSRSKDRILRTSDDATASGSPAVEVGRSIFQAKCRNCHDGYSASLITFPSQLYNPEYVAYILASDSEHSSLEKLDKTDIGKLIQFLSSSQPETKPQQVRKKLLLGTRLYERILSEGLAKSCRHCHNNSNHTKDELLAVFGRAPKLFFLEYENKTLTIASKSRPALEAGPGCSDSILVQHLKERRNEEEGQGTALSGMPMSVAALPADLISDFRLWTTQGCPSPQGLLCSPCISE